MTVVTVLRLSSIAASLKMARPHILYDENIRAVAPDGLHKNRMFLAAPSLQPLFPYLFRGRHRCVPRDERESATWGMSGAQQARRRSASRSAWPWPRPHRPAVRPARPPGQRARRPPARRRRPHQPRRHQPRPRRPPPRCRPPPPRRRPPFRPAAAGSRTEYPSHVSAHGGSRAVATVGSLGCTSRQPAGSGAPLDDPVAGGGRRHLARRVAGVDRMAGVLRVAATSSTP